MKYLFTFFMFFSSSVFAMLPFKPITATVIDAETKDPLPFTNIFISGQNRGTVSNHEGIFILDLEGVAPQELIVFTHVGYETLKVSAKELKNLKIVSLPPATINLREVQVLSKSLTAKQIVALVKEKYPENHPETSLKQNVFFHKYEKVPFPKENQIKLKKVNFVGIDKGTFQELYRKMPQEFIEYQDAILELYSEGDNHKIVPVKAISMEEGSQQALVKEVESKLGVFFNDIEETSSNPDTYYKIRTGIIGIKAGKEQQSDSILHLNKEDTLNYTLKTEEVKTNLLSLLGNYANLKSKNWEFINKAQKYHYELKEITSINDELVYEISFTPRRGGLFEGVMYISMENYAILQLDFAFAEGKKNENFQLLGVGHSMNFKKGHVIFEKGKGGYFLKYLYAQQNESASIDRDFTILKKQKRFLIDKTVNTLKFEAELSFAIYSSWELLILNREPIDVAQFEKVNQPRVIKFKKEYAYTPEMWNNRTVIAPTSALKEFKRK